MQETVSAAEAKRRFSLILRGVREGRRYIVTCHGRPVAWIVPAGQSAAIAPGAQAALLSRLDRQPVVDAGHWARSALYDDDR
ncbi:MAG: type II toxin-antitoxin system prevent-host-death family antitoxin [Burkholderiaceae bacterium]